MRARSRNTSLPPCRRRLPRRSPIRCRRRIRRRAGCCILFAAEPSADRNHRQRGAAFDRRDPCAGPRCRHHHHRRHQRHLDALSHRYGVTTAEILKANGYKGPRALQPGQQLIIPPRAVVAAAAPAAVAPKAAAAAAPVAAPPSVHVVNRGDTLMSIAHRNRVPVAELAKVNGIDANSKLKLGQKINVPGAKSAAAPAAAQPAQVAAAQPGAVAAPATKMAAVELPKEKARLAQATTTPEAAAAVTETPVKTAEATGALPTFRWPVRGRVVTGYGAKTNGKSNDGINVAVPEGTPVKAAEDGVVAYSGNELKGYGNLILVRHSNGYVTAYAHASELLVKRGETIKRGQIIAKSGQSGEVGSPQLHFEIRKGSSPVDPLQFLNGA